MFDHFIKVETKRRQNTLTSIKWQRFAFGSLSEHEAVLKDDNELTPINLREKNEKRKIVEQKLSEKRGAEQEEQLRQLKDQEEQIQKSERLTAEKTEQQEEVLNEDYQVEETTIEEWLSANGSPALHYLFCFPQLI